MNGLELARSAVAEWRKWHGDESLYGWCQWFDGWYMSWAYAGFTDEAERSLRRYQTAQIAADASTMYETRDVNSRSILPGDSLYFEYGRPGHIVTAIGWHGSRLLVTQTGNGGDTVLTLGNNVKISHADTLGMKFIGASRRNGANPRRVGVTAYMHGETVGSPAGSTSVKSRTVRKAVNGVLFGRTAPSTKSGRKAGSLKPGTSAKFDAYRVGQKVTVAGVSSAVWFRRRWDRKWYAAAGFTSQSTAGLKRISNYVEPKPKRRYARLSAAWFYFGSSSEARSAQKGHDGPTLPPGDYRLVDQSDRTSPYRVYVDGASGRSVWIGTPRTSPKIITK